MRLFNNIHGKLFFELANPDLHAKFQVQFNPIKKQKQYCDICVHPEVANAVQLLSTHARSTKKSVIHRKRFGTTF